MKSAVRLKVKVVPGASSSGVAGWLGDMLKIRVAAPPERGKANAAVLELLARELHLKECALSIVSGSASQKKLIEIQGITMSDIQEKFGASRA
jgi:hypothetical protein